MPTARARTAQDEKDLRIIESGKAAFVLVMAMEVLLSVCPARAAVDRPNVVLIMADDNDQLSWGIAANSYNLLVFLGNFKPQLSQANSREIGGISYTLLHRVRVWPL